MTFGTVLNKLQHKQNLTAEEAQRTFDDIFAGQIPDEQIATFLLNLIKKGETVNELLGAVKSMRSKAQTISAPNGAMDIVGTGGDAHGTFNISTAVALVVAGCGVDVAKHGNKAASSKSGSSDVLAALGLRLDLNKAELERCLSEAHLCFLFAPNHHPAMRHVAAIRKRLGVRTIFNLLGPLTNPADVKRHLIGVYDLEWLGPMAEVLKLLGSEVAWLAHGHDGMDEITTTDATDIVELRNNMMQHFTLEPEHIDLQRVPLAALAGGDAAHNAAALKQVLQGQTGPYRDIVVFNASAALIVAGKAKDLRHGRDMAEQSIDRGAAQATLDLLIRLTNDKAA